MKVLVDSGVWGLALRKKKTYSTPEQVLILTELIRNSQVLMIGSIRQEVLSGLSNQLVFDRLKDSLSGFPDVILNSEYFELAADFSNQCRRKGIQGSHTDFLICSVSYLHEAPIFTLDRDFEYYSSVLPIRLFMSV